MASQLDLRQSVLRTALNMAGTAAGATADTIAIANDPLFGKLFEDRNVMLTDGGTITFTGTQLQFTEALNINVLQRISGGAPLIISLGSTSQAFANSGDMWVAVINRTTGTATSSIITNGNALPAVSSANEEVFFIARRDDANDGTQRLYFRNGSSMNAGQSVRLGQGGSGGSGSGVGDDLDALTFRASFSDAFSEASTQAVSSILTANTNAAFSAAKSMYTMQYDASKTVTGSGTSMTLSAAPAFTVQVGDLLIQGTEARQITAVASQTSFTIESAFTLVPSPSAAQATVSQAVYTKDIYNSALDGSAIAASFPGTTFSEIMVDYKDNAVSNSNLWTPDVTPLVAFTATNTGTTFTTKQTRATNTTDTMQSTFLPAAGSALSLRFFANATSGSGFVNLLTYKAFMQKVTTAISGGIMNSALGFTNNSATPSNMTIATVGGKTTLTLNFNYAVGANSGTAEASIEVYINGSKIPRFVSSTLTPDASFTETSVNVITLDRDYSSQALSVTVVQRTSGQPVDSSSTNVTAISQIQEATSMGFQSFINTNTLMSPTSLVGTPVAGTFYSTIPFRASIVDFTQDLKPRMAVERIPVQQITLLPNEFGPNGEQVWSAIGDTFNQMRFVGMWTNLTDNNGTRPYTALNTTDYCEITFYGTGLNLISIANAAIDARVSIDGGAEGSNVYPTGLANVIGNRGYDVNHIIPVASGLALGVHTVKIRNNSTSLVYNVHGFEILNQSANVITNPGAAYIGGKKIASGSQSSIAYNASVVGTRGGRVLQYLTASGTIAQAFTPANAAAAFYTSADHTNEEIVRAIAPREFGANRSDDFSTQLGTGTFSARAFTLDDGTTTLVTSSADSVAGAAPVDGLRFGVAGATITLTFVGTGLDIWRMDNITSASDTVTISIDGGATTTLSTLNTNRRLEKVVSGLPYGTHTARFTQPTMAAGRAQILQFIVYQPKKPTLPAGAVELADYNVMANYVANATAGSTTVAQGVLRKMNTRELIYLGTNWSIILDSGELSGFQANSGNSGANNDSSQFTFFGTGFEFRFQSYTGTSAATATLTVDGSTNLSSYTTSYYGTNVSSFNAATGVISFAQNTATNYGCGVQVSGLPLGLHTIKFAHTTGTNTYISAFDVITPIHSYKSNSQAIQNAISVGSNAISDNRQFSAVKATDARGKASYVAYGVTTNPTTNANTWVPMPEMVITMKVDRTTRFLVGYSADMVSSSNSVQCLMYVDGVPVGAGSGGGGANNPMGQYVSSGNGATMSQQLPITLSPGVHTLILYWNCNTTVTNYARTMFAVEL